MIFARRRRAFVLALLLFVSTVVPVRQSHAYFFIPPLVMSLVGAGGAVLASDALLAASTTALGMTALLMVVTIPSDNPVSVRVPLTADQTKTDSVMPAPAAPSTSSLTLSQQCSYQASGAPWYPSCEAAFAAWAAIPGSCSYYDGGWIQGSSGASLISIVGSSVTYNSTCSGHITGKVTIGFSLKSVSSCPSGYSASGPGCVLSNSRLVTSDNKIDYKRTATGYSSLEDVDSSKASNSRVNGSGVQVWGQDSSGAPVVVDVSPASGGGTKINVQRQSASAGGQSIVKTDSYLLNETTGAVQSIASTSAAGRIGFSESAAGSTAVPDIVTGAAIAPVESSSGASSEPVVFPSDYARSGEAAIAANTIKTSVDGVKDKLTNSVDVSDPTVPDWADGWTSTFNPLKSWSMAGHASVCPTGGFSWNGEVYLIDSHCQLYENHSSSLQTASIVVWTIAALFVLLGA